MKTALLLIDIQNDYFSGGRMELEGPGEAAAQSSRLLNLFRVSGLPRIHIQHISTRPGAIFFLPGTEGVDIHASVAPLPGEVVIQKHFPNSFRETPLLYHLRGQDSERLVIAGMMTHMCVDATVRAASDLGFQVLVAADACATRALSYSETTVPAAYVQAALLAAFRSYGSVMTTDEILAQLTKETAA
jgi:nicotinamidase-related amidase